MCCRLIILQCDICRDGAMTLICVMQSNGFRENGVGLVVVVST
ncbi:hypothetical protein FHS72_003322 [Loktanella ponticola]|uniref:Uncharacterized protein n=1 Tax=Yoonia ponticola TaxID=1524255 RepID=A0A7W9BNL8_9RHOB|nr:hypothetical protein [Yoonia ponticola]